jgi:hypothetical protein
MRATGGIMCAVALLIAASSAAAAAAETAEENARRVEWFWFPFPIHSPETDWASDETGVYFSVLEAF